jgi:Protein of unknown function (DUF3128)
MSSRMALYFDILYEVNCAGEGRGVLRGSGLAIARSITAGPQGVLHDLSLVDFKPQTLQICLPGLSNLLHPPSSISLCIMGFWGSSKSNSQDASSSPPKDPREAAADAELAALLATLDAEAAEVAAGGGASKKNTGPQEKPKPNSAFPEEMSCVTAFDEMYYCYSLGGQFLNGIYFNRIFYVYRN